MQFESFKRIVTTFADENNEVVVGEGHLLLYIRGELVEAEIKAYPDGIQVKHNGAYFKAESWICSYLARLSTLADRIISYVSPPEYYVSPSVTLLDWQNEPEQTHTSLDSASYLRDRLSQPLAGMTSIHFLTSDAGEGKTSLIEKISVDQASAFKKKETRTLILPVPLGGRPFLRLDDAIVASLLNRLRFPFLYYDSFLELVKMGAIVPAFDGFEEMLVGAKSESEGVISAIGHLLNQLSSTGTLLVAARKAYFDVSVNAQTKLLDSVRSDQNVGTYRFVLNRWNRDVFLEYARKRVIPNPEKLYYKVVERLGQDDEHPVLTRAVLVQRLMDVAKEEEDLEKFLRRLSHSHTNYFFDFVEGIIGREVYKWLDTPGDRAPLLTLDEHHELLSDLASEMWINSVDTLNLDVVRLVVELFAIDKKHKSPNVLRQISIRIPDHSLLRKEKIRNIIRIRFDHEDFQEFYIGQALARALEIWDISNIKLILNARALTPPVIKEATRYLTAPGTSVSIERLLDKLHELSRGRWHSYTRENCAALILELVEFSKKTHSIVDVSFPSNALQQRKLQNLKISSSFFNSTSLVDSEIINCGFYDCRFAQLILDGSEKLDGTVFDECTFHSIAIGKDSEDQRVFFDRNKMHIVLNNRGVKLKSQSEEIAEAVDLPSMDDDMKIAMQFIRMFNRATAITNDVIGQRMGKQSNYFFKKILPKLQSARLVGHTDRSSNKLRLMVPLSHIDKLVEDSGSIFDQFIQEASSQELGVALT